MTPADFRETLKRQGLSQRTMARLVYSSLSMVSRWCNGVHRVPGGVEAFLALREGMFHPDDVTRNDARSLLHYCRTKGLTYRQGKSHITKHILHLKHAKWNNYRNYYLREKARLWDG